MKGELVHIFRHPIKAHGREELSSITLSEEACLPWDRHWAVAHDAARLSSGWNPCQNFSRGAKAPELMAVTAHFDDVKKLVTLSHPKRGDITFNPSSSEDLPQFLKWVRPLCPPERAQPNKIIRADRGMTDSPYPSVSIMSLNSLNALSEHTGRDLSIHRWRGNLWIDGGDPFSEFDWVGQQIDIGNAVLEIKEPITRCKATTVNPATGAIDTDTLQKLFELNGHRDFGVNAVVIQGGKINTGDGWRLRQ